MGVCLLWSLKCAEHLRWGFKGYKVCVILKYSIPTLKGFDLCYKFIFITNTLPHLSQKNFSSESFSLSIVVALVRGSYEETVEFLMKIEGSSGENILGGINYEFFFTGAIVSKI